MKLLFRTIVLLVLAVSLCANATAAGQEELSPEIQGLVSVMRLMISETMTKAENQFFKNMEVFTQSAGALSEITDGFITYESRTTDAYPVLHELETVNGKQLYILSKKEFPENHMSLLRDSGALDVFLKTGCREIMIDADYIIYWWDMPVVMVAGGIIYTKNRDGLESWYKIQKELDDNWATFLYTSI